MKPIIIDMKDISDSTEVYESRPNPVLTGFIYLILAMVVVALCWMYFFKIDIVVKGTGTVAAADEVATVTNQNSGKILERRIEDGQAVKEGDVLYIVAHEEQSLQLSVLEKQLAEWQERENMLKAYDAWLNYGNEFPVELKDNLYYNEMVSRKRLIELGQQNTLQMFSGEMVTYDAKLNANGEMISYYSDAIAKSRQLIEAIEKGENSFSREDAYYWNTIENYLAQYEYTEEQYEEKIDALWEQREGAKKEIEALEAQLQENREQGIGSVSDGDAWDALLQEQIANQKSIKETADSNMKQYKDQRDSALNAYEKESIAAVEKSILSYEQNMVAYEGNQKEYVSGQNTLREQGTEVELENLLTQEKHNVAGELESCRQTARQLEQQIDELKKLIEDSTVTASKSGTVNFANDLVKGDFVAAGTQVLSIIPDTDTGKFIVKSYIENKDIAKVHEGMKVTYEIAAYPSREYGTMEGVVTFVSADLKVNSSGSAYYVVETSVDATDLYNSQGEAAALKIGMLCEARIVVEEKSVLAVLLEKFS